MKRPQRTLNFIIALALIMLSIIMIAVPEHGYRIMTILLALTLISIGLRYLIYYYTMSRYMVGGRYMFFIGVVILDFGVFTGTLLSVPKIYALIYLIGTYVFDGVVSFLRAREAKQYGASSWKGKLAYSMIRFVMAVVSLIFIRHSEVLVIIYSIGVIYSAIMRIVTTLRTTAIVYIQ